ncbi:hypothetical protein TRIP_B210028 [uncultured Desulfatiglans sp.]|uniref:Uncharacterized protein n=1 Tax=Uncultured Desulfatiglans sp. TaxID=1748965 RepID=A0A653A3R2_UNCDX|nr:hypothetical protein TRIP_B210028 [uncultured Desulfatiglans sp.]
MSVYAFSFAGGHHQLKRSGFNFGWHFQSGIVLRLPLRLPAGPAIPSCSPVSWNGRPGC